MPTGWPEVTPDLEAVLAAHAETLGGDGLLHSRHGLSQATLRPGVRAPGNSSRSGRRLHLGTERRVGDQRAGNLAWQLDEEGIELSILPHDRNRKFAGSFDRVFGSSGARVVLTPLMAPEANAHAELWGSQISSRHPPC